MTLEERLQVETVVHKGRVAAAFGVAAWAVLAAVFWVTATPKRWIAPLVAVALAGVLYTVLR